MRLKGIVEKGWGSEEIWVTNDNYCSKFMHFNAGAKFSMHFHAEKEETWFVNAGQFMLRYIDTKTAELKQVTLNEGDVWHNPPLQPHQLIAMQADSIIFEVSTADSVEDNYRLLPGDSQGSIKVPEDGN